MALDTFYYSSLYCNYFFFLTRKIKCLGFGVILVFSHGSLVIKKLTGGINVFSIFSRTLKMTQYPSNQFFKKTVTHGCLCFLIF